LSKPRWIVAFCIVSALAIVAVFSFVLSPAHHSRRAQAASAASQPPAAAPAARFRVQANYAALPLAFEQNQGQTDSQVKYMARGDGYILFLAANDAVFSLQSRSSNTSTSRAPALANTRQHTAQKVSAAVVRMQLAGSNSLAKVSASDLLPGKSNYFMGNDPSKWHSNVPHYARVSYQDVYPGVNLAFHGARRQTEFDFVVAPGANPAPIGFRFTGAKGIKTDDTGNLVISSAAGDVQLHKPFAYQEQNGARQAVDARFVLKADNQVSFELGNYDHSRELVIDPSVSYAYSTYLGGSGNDGGQGIAFDGAGNAYVTGETTSPTFPHASGTLTDGAAVFVTKIAPDGSTLVYSTYVQGTVSTASDSGNAISVDASGNVFVAGSTSSTDFPVMPNPGAFQTTLKSTAGNAFVFELSSSGSIIYCTYLGGSTGQDTAIGIALAAGSSAGDVYVVGKTSSTDFPTLNPLQANPLTGSTNAGFVTKLNSTGTALVYSTYLGGSPTGDFAEAVAVDSSDNAYVTGQTSNPSFPIHASVGSVLQPTYGGGTDAFVTVINPNGNSYVYSTFLGGSDTDIGDGITVDSSSNAYVTGKTHSSNTSTKPFPLKSALQPTFGGGIYDAFVAKLNPTGTALLYSTYLGGSGDDYGGGIAVDVSGNAYVTGQTDSPSGSGSFPLVGATQATPGGGFDAFVSEINSTGSALVFSTYLGGSGDENFSFNYGAIAVDSTGANIYVTGSTTPKAGTTNNFPTTTGAFQTSDGGGTDAFIVKYTTSSTGPTFSLSATALSPASVSAGSSATSMVSVTGANGFSGTVTLSCAVSGPAGAVHLPTCAPASVAAGATGTLTVDTTAAIALLQRPANRRSSGVFYAMFVPIGGIALLGFGANGRQGKKLFGFLLLGLVLSGFILMPACGGSSHSSGGSPGTTAGTYNITVTGTASGASETGTAPALTLTVN